MNFITRSALSAILLCLVAGCHPFATEEDVEERRISGSGDSIDKETPSSDIEKETDLEDDTETTGTRPYRYVLIRAVGECWWESGCPPDIDAVLLFKHDGTTASADRVESWIAAPPEEAHPDEVLGWPDAFEDYSGTYTDPEAGTDTCRVDGGYVALHQLIAHISAPMQVGDILAILEVGDCTFGTGPECEPPHGCVAIPENFRVAVSPDPDPESDLWITLGEGTGPIVFFELHELDLPPVPIDP